MKLVLETLDIQTALQERQDWHTLRHKTRITEVKKVFQGGYQLVYRVWVGDRIIQNIIRCSQCNEFVTGRFPVCLCGYGKATG